MHMAPSPKRALSTSRFLQALDALHEPAPTFNKVDNPLGIEWPLAQTTSTASTSRIQGPILPPSSTTVAASVTERPLMKTKAKSTQPKASSSTKSKSILANSTRQMDTLTATLTSPVARKPASKGSKENGDIQDSPPIIFNPPIVHPLPLYSYKTYNSESLVRVYTRHEEEADDLVDSLTGPVGFDIEWKVVFRRGSPMRPAATVQLSDRRMILIIQISAMKGFPKRLKVFLEDPKIAKVGANILNDGNKLARDYGVHAQGLVELGGLARLVDAHYVERYFRALDPNPETVQDSTPNTKLRKSSGIMSLAAVTAMYTGHTLSKGPVRTSNWEAIPLDGTQLEYASNDAHCALMVYVRLTDMAEEAEVQLEPANYTSGVDPQYRMKSATPLRVPAIKNASSSSSSSTSTSGYDAEASLTESTSTSSFMRRYSAMRATSVRRARVSSPPETTAALPRNPERAPSSDALRSIGGSSSTISSYRTTSTTGGPANLLSTPMNSRSTSATSVTSTIITDNDIDEIINQHATSSLAQIPSETNETLKIGKTFKLPLKLAPRFKPNYSAFVPPDSSSSVSTPVSRSESSPKEQPLAYQPVQSRAQAYQTPQHIRAYHLWHDRETPLPDICSALRSPDNPLKKSTVISYVIGALRTDPALPFSYERLKMLIDTDKRSWNYHGKWFDALSARIKDESE